MRLFLGYMDSVIVAINVHVLESKLHPFSSASHPILPSSIAAVETVQSAGKVCILDIDVQGVQNVKKSSLSAIYVFIAPPSMDELEQRLRGRATESEEDIQRRLGNAAKEIEYGTKEGNFDKVFVNDDLVKTFELLVKAVKVWYPHLKEHMRPRPVVFAGPSGVGKVS